MEFNKIKLHGRYVLDLPLLGARPSDSYHLKSVDGLGPPDIDVVVANHQYAGRTTQSREVVMRIELNPNFALGETASSLREALYGLLVANIFQQLSAQSSKIELLLDDTPVVYTEGYIKKFEIVPFTKDQEVQITFSCPNPYLEASRIVEVDVSTLGYTQFKINNPGTAPTGVYWQWRMLVATSNMLFYGPESALGWWLFGYQAVGGDGEEWAHAGMRVELDTRPGYRYTSQVDADGTRWNALQSVSPESTGDWPMLHGGENIFTTGKDATQWAWERVWFRPQYWGV